MNYKGFANQNIEVVAGFDNNPARINPDGKPVPILPITELTAFVQAENIQVAVLAVPENAAAGILDQLSAAGVQGVLNFSPAQLKADPHMFIQNINIAFEIENLFHYVRFRQRQDSGQL
jgi:redox-sensing transcriptional repressor